MIIQTSGLIHTRCHTQMAWWHVFVLYYSGISYCMCSTGLEKAVAHWPFFNPFRHLTNQNPFWLAKFPIHFQCNSNQ